VKYKSLLIIGCCVLTLICQALTPRPSGSGNRTRIILENSDSTIYSESLAPDKFFLYGNVEFSHDSARLYCDSAYLYQNTNSLEAFGNVLVEQGDTLFIYGSYLIYEGDTKIAKMRENVRMEHDRATLFTENLDFDRNRNLGYFFDGGLMVDSVNELTSVYGQYSPDNHVATFRNTVVLTNPQFVLTSDTLEYATDSNIATILGPAVIKSDSGYIHSSLGKYNTNTQQATLYLRSTVYSKDGTRSLTADTLFYNRETALGEAFHNILMKDTLQDVALTGHYGYFNDADNYAFVTDSAQFIEFSQRDSLFLHADTLQMRSIDEHRELKAFHGVRFYRIDLQGVCDSLHFNTQDSILYMINHPVLWNNSNQITGDTIKIIFNDSTVERVHVIDRAFSIEQLDSTYFNQVKGRLLTAYFTAGELSRVDVEGTTESIYYPLEEHGTEFVGRNRTESPNMSIFVENRKPVRIWWDAAKGEMLPIPDLHPDQKFLKDFVHLDYLRPLNKWSIFSKIVPKAEDMPAPPRKRRR